MEGFSKLPKMQCFKAGGSVQNIKAGGSIQNVKAGGSIQNLKEGGSSDLAQDKKLIKKAFKQHDEAEHDKEPTEIKLKKGGRSKKTVGTVNKYKAGGAIGMKKDDGDIDDIKKIKATKAEKLCMGGKA